MHCVTSALCWHSTLPRWLPTVLSHCGCTTSRHVCHQHQQAASGTEHTGCRVVCQTLRSVSVTEFHRQLHWQSTLVTNMPTNNIQESRRCIWDENHWHSCLPLSLDSRLPTRTDLRSADKLLLSVPSVPRMALSFLAKAFSVSAPSVWNALSHNCSSAEVFSTFRHNCIILKLNSLTLLTATETLSLVSIIMCLCVLIDWSSDKWSALPTTPNQKIKRGKKVKRQWAVNLAPLTSEAFMWFRVITLILGLYCRVVRWIMWAN